MGREFGGGIWIRKRGFVIWDWEFVEFDGGGGDWVPAMDTIFCLTEVYGCSGEVEWEVIGGDEAGEVEELV